MEPFKIFSVGSGMAALTMGTLAVVFGVKYNECRKILANSPATGVVVDSGSPGSPQAVPNKADFRGVGAKLFEFLRFMNKIEGGKFSGTVENAFAKELEMVELGNCNLHYLKIHGKDGSYVIDRGDPQKGQNGVRLDIVDALEELRKARENRLALSNITKDDLQEKINEVEGTNATVIPSLYIGDDGVIRHSKLDGTHVELTLKKAKKIVKHANLIEKKFSEVSVREFETEVRTVLKGFVSKLPKASRLVSSAVMMLALGGGDFEAYSQVEMCDPNLIEDCFSDLGEAYVKYADEFGIFQDIRKELNSKIEKAKNPGEKAAPLYMYQLKYEASEAQKVLDKLGELDKLVKDARKQAK